MDIATASTVETAGEVSSRFASAFADSSQGRSLMFGIDFRRALLNYVGGPDLSRNVAPDKNFWLAFRSVL